MRERTFSARPSPRPATEGSGSIHARGRLPKASRSHAYEAWQRAPILFRMQARLQTCPSWIRTATG